MSLALAWCCKQERGTDFTQWRRESLFLLDDILGFLDEELSLLMVFHNQFLVTGDRQQRVFSFCSVAAFLALTAYIGLSLGPENIKVEGKTGDFPLVVPDSQEEEDADIVPSL